MTATLIEVSALIAEESLSQLPRNLVAYNLHHSESKSTDVTTRPALSLITPGIRNPLDGQSHRMNHPLFPNYVSDTAIQLFLYHNAPL
jgi:hypothetical protein